MAFDAKDFTLGTAKTFKTTDNAGTHTPHHIVDSSALPTGAATAAKQPALGTAGSSSTDVISVQGIASGTALPVSGTFWQATQPVSGTVTADLGATDNAVLDAIAASLALLDNAVSGNELQVDIASSVLPSGAATSANQSTANTALAAIQTAVEILDNAISGTEMQVDIVSSALPTGAATETTLAAVATAVGDVEAAITAQQFEAVAHDAADAGDSLKFGFKAVAALSGVTLVAAADRTDSYADLDGALLTRPHGALGDLVRGRAAITDGASTSVIAAAGAGVKIYVTDVIISNSSATAAEVDLRDGAAGSVLATFPAPTDGGVVFSLNSPIAFTANTAVCADPDAALTTITVTLCGFKSKI